MDPNMAADAVFQTPPSRHQLAVTIWLAVFPTLTVLNLALSDWRSCTGCADSC
jgi:hypothetical protein